MNKLTPEQRKKISDGFLVYVMRRHDNGLIPIADATAGLADVLTATTEPEAECSTDKITEWAKRNTIPMGNTVVVDYYELLDFLTATTEPEGELCPWCKEPIVPSSGGTFGKYIHYHHKCWKEKQATTEPEDESFHQAQWILQSPGCPCDNCEKARNQIALRKIEEWIGALPRDLRGTMFARISEFRDWLQSEDK